MVLGCLRGLVMDRHTDELSDIGTCRVAFAPEKWKNTNVKSYTEKDSDKKPSWFYLFKWKSKKRPDTAW